jgi:hypothetical protein
MIRMYTIIMTNKQIPHHLFQPITSPSLISLAHPIQSHNLSLPHTRQTLISTQR